MVKKGQCHSQGMFQIQYARLVPVIPIMSGQSVNVMFVIQGIDKELTIKFLAIYKPVYCQFKRRNVKLP